MKNRTTIQVSEELRKELRILASKRDISYQKLLQDMISVFKELDRKKTIISIPSKLSEKIKKRIEGTDISSVSEYLTFLLRLIIAEDLEVEKTDESRIKEKLRKLGYV